MPGYCSWVCVCPPKALEFGKDRHLHRVKHEELLRRVLSDVPFNEGTATAQIILPGGGIVLEAGASATYGVYGQNMAVFSGNLENFSHLIKNHCSQEGLPVESTIIPSSEAELICSLYVKMGTTLVSKLRGDFTFVIYDSKLMRVLAARSASSGQGLRQCRGSDDSLVVASGPYEPAGCHDTQEIPAGYFKYGWHSEPQKFANPVHHPPASAAPSAAAAVQRALNGIKVGSVAKTDSSEDDPDTPTTKGKTRRGKRAGRAQREKATQYHQHRLSLDSHAIPSRADQDGWWRNSLDHPRQPPAVLAPAAFFPMRSRQSLDLSTRPEMRPERRSLGGDSRTPRPPVPGSSLRADARPWHMPDTPDAARGFVDRPPVEKPISVSTPGTATAPVAPEMAAAAAKPELKGEQLAGAQRAFSSSLYSPARTPAAAASPRSPTRFSREAVATASAVRSPAAAAPSATAAPAKRFPPLGDGFLKAAGLQPIDASGLAPGDGAALSPRILGVEPAGGLFAAPAKDPGSPTAVATWGGKENSPRAGESSEVSGKSPRARKGLGGRIAEFLLKPRFGMHKSSTAMDLAASGEEFQDGQSMLLAGDAFHCSSPSQLLPHIPAELVEKLVGPYREDAGSLRMLVNLLNKSPCSVCVTDATAPDHPIVYVNSVFETLTGYSSQEVLGVNCRFLQAPPGEERLPSFMSASVRKVLEQGRGTSAKLLNYSKDGHAMTNELSIVPLRNSKGEVTHHVGMQTFRRVEQSTPLRPNRLATGINAYEISASFGVGSKSKSCGNLVEFSSARDGLAY